MGPNWGGRDTRINDWMEKQAQLFPRLLYFFEKARKNGYDKDPAIQAVLECFQMHVKADFMEELILLGDMTPTRDGLRKFVSSLPAAERQKIENHYKDPDKIGPAKRKNLRKRWISYRRDLIKKTSNDRLFLKMESLNVPPETAIAKVNNHKITMGQFLAVHGSIKNDVHWNSIKKSRLSQMMLSYAMADEVDKLKILPKRYMDKIELSKRLYFAAHQIVYDYGPETLGRENSQVDFQFFREIARYLNLLKLEKLFIAGSEKMPIYQSIWIDKEYLFNLKWIIEPAFTPKQASYF